MWPRTQDPSFAGFSAERGEVFYLEKHLVKGAGMVSCASCHLKDARYSVYAHQSDIPCLMTFEGGSKGDLINVGNRSAKRAAVPQ